MDTPIYDFVKAYAGSDTVRLHMPGHKGRPVLGCEAMDITEIPGADTLYEASGIIAKSEANAATLFGSGRTLYATEGSSQCIRAMLYLALVFRERHTAPLVLAARNVHRSFLFAAALLDLEVTWLWPEASRSLCSCPVSAEHLERPLADMERPPAAVYVTSPDYLGGMQDIAALAAVCHRHGTRLLVDNAHGAYLRFLEPAQHPLDLGADLCCDSAHKTLPVLTGGAYLHLAKATPPAMQAQAKTAMALFGSTSPAYLTLASLDRCNRTLAEGYPARLAETAAALEQVRQALRDLGWQVEASDPLRLTVTAPAGYSGEAMAERLRKAGMECEYADPFSLVCMVTPENTQAELDRIPAALGPNLWGPAGDWQLPDIRGQQVCSIRQAVFAPQETVAIESALGRVCAAPTVACPPAVPLAVSGERITPEVAELFCRYGVTQVDVVGEAEAF